MAILRAQWSDTATSGTGDRSITITPAVGDLLVVFCALSDNTNPAPICTDNNPEGSGYASLGAISKREGADTMSAFIRNARVPSAVPTTITIASGSNTSACLVVLAISDLLPVSLAAIRQVEGLSGQSGGTPHGTFAANTIPADIVLGACFTGDDPTGLNPPLGWTGQDIGVRFPGLGLEVASTSGYSSQQVTWQGIANSGWGTIIIEILCSTIRPVRVALAIAGSAPSLVLTGVTLLTPASAALALYGQPPLIAEVANTSVTPSSGALALAPVTAVLGGVARRYATVDIDTLPTYYDGQLVDEPVISRSLTDTFWGPVQFDQVRFALANVEGTLTPAHLMDMRGRATIVRRYDAVSGYLREAFVGTISRTALAPGKLWIEATSLDVPSLSRLLPTGLITKDDYPDSPESERDVPIPVVFGYVSQLRLPCIKADPVAGIWDYAVGWTRTDGTPLEVVKLYRDGVGVLSSTRTITIESSTTATFHATGGAAATWPQFVPHDSVDRALVVILQITENLADATDVIYGGIRLSRLATVTGAGTPRISVWALLAPPPGSHMVQVAVPNGTPLSQIIGTSISLTGVLQSGDVRQSFGVAVRTGTSAEVSISITSVPGDLAIGAMAFATTTMTTTPVIRAWPGQTVLWSQRYLDLLGVGAWRQATSTSTGFVWPLGTPIAPVSPFGGWTAIAITASPAPAATVDTATYPGVTAIRFGYALDRTGGDRVPTVRADVIGMLAERNPVTAVQTLVSDARWGWSQAIDADSFDTARTALAASGLPTLHVDGALTRQEEAQQWLSELLIIRGMRLRLNSGQQWQIMLDAVRSTTALAVGDGIGDGLRSIVDVDAVSWEDAADSAKSVELQYREDLTGSGYLYSITRTISTLRGAEKVYRTRFIREHETASVVNDWLTKRLSVGARTCTLVLPQQARDLQEGDLISVTRPDLGLSGTTLEVAAIVDRLTAIEVTARSYDATLFTYTAGPDPEPEDPTPTAWQDYANVPPDSAVNFVRGASSIVTVNGEQVASVAFVWDAPAVNAATSIIRYRLTPYELETPGSWVSGLTVSGNGPGQTGTVIGPTPGEYYDFSIQIQTAGLLISSDDPVLEGEVMPNLPLAPNTPALSLLQNMEGQEYIEVRATLSGTAAAVDLYRGTVNNPRVATLVHAMSLVSQSLYRVSDTPPVPGTYYYWVQSRTVLGSIRSGMSRSEYNSVAYTG